MGWPAAFFYSVSVISTAAALCVMIYFVIKA